MDIYDFNEISNKDFRIGIVGLGLIGGSLAKAFREALPHSVIVAYNRRELPRKRAIEEGVADIVTDKIDEKFADCDYIFLCTPVEYNAMYLKEIKAVMKESCIITDAGSTKTNIHEAVIAENLEANFIGGHPMAGSEKAGYEFSTPWLYKNAYYVITPTPKTNMERLKELEMIVKSIGAKPVIIDDYKKHDYAVAGISHVPHVISAELANMVKYADTDDFLMKRLAANGFKDTTRIAASSPEMWQQICMTNKDNIVMLMDKYIERLTNARNRLAEGDSQFVYDLFTESREYRGQFGSRLSGNPNDL